MRSIVPVVVILLIVGAVVAIVRGVVGRIERVVQPIAFNHTIHLDKAGLECGDCHTSATTDVAAGLPSKNICLDCHDPDDDEAEPHPGLARLYAFADSDGDIPWRRVAITKPDVFFSHRRHVSAAGLDCLQCHSDQPTLTAPPSTAQEVMSMDACIKCHEDNAASVDCLACHR